MYTKSKVSKAQKTRRQELKHTQQENFKDLHLFLAFQTFSCIIISYGLGIYNTSKYTYIIIQNTHTYKRHDIYAYAKVQNFEKTNKRYFLKSFHAFLIRIILMYKERYL